MKLSNPLRNILTPGEQRIVLFLGLVILVGCTLDFVGWSPLQATKIDPDSLFQAVKNDVPVQLDIRIATREELITLPSIGEKKAQDIIDYRDKNPFTSVNQILNVKGIGAKTYAKLLPNLLAFGDTTNVESTASGSTKKTSDKKKTSTPKAELNNIVNINQASLSELCTLSGIGEVKAKAIITWREENGDFTSIEDITKVKGIGQKTLEKNRHRLKV